MTNGHAKVLIMAPSWLGDAVMSLPLVGRLAASGVGVSVLASAYTARVYQGLGPVDELVVLPKSVWERARAIRALGIDGGVLLAPSFSSALTLFLSGVRIRVGYANDGRRALLSDPPPSRNLRDEHVADNYARLGGRLVERFGLAFEESACPSLRVFDQERQSIRRRLDASGEVGAEYVVMVPGATYGPTKSWPADKYQELAGRLSENVPVVLAGGPKERELCESVRGNAGSVVNLAGDTTLGELFALVEGARVVVANDSGVPHVAGSLGVPTVVIFGSTSPTWTQPLGDNVRVVREPVHCSPCFLRACPTQLECYEAITVERVLDAVGASGAADGLLVGNASRRDGERT